MSGAEPWTGSNMLGVGAVGVDVAAGREADAAGDGRGDVGDDVAEQVVGDDDVEAPRVGDQEDRGRVDVLVGRLDLGELGADLVDGAAPQVAGVGEHVVLVDEREVLARPGLGAGEGVADDPLDAEPRVDADLGGDLVRGAARSAPPLPTYGPSVPSRTTTKSIPSGGPLDGQRARHPRVELGRAAG